MKRLLLNILTLCSLSLSAQTQQGFVKTLGRPNQKGIALNGVSVRVKGAHNAVLSKADGTFSMPIQGESYALQQVQKQGYELKESGIIGRKYAFSSKVPLTIVMVSTKQLQADKQRIENRAYQVAEKNYKTKQSLLEKQKSDNVLTIEQYRKALQDLQAKFENYQSLISDLADHYAHVDYDDMDAKEQEINKCIEDGDLERAHSLLQQMGILQRAEDIAHRLSSGQQLMEAAQQDQQAVLKQQEKDAEHLYQLYTIALGRFDNERARFYIETRAELDTTDVRWQIDAAEFVMTYVNDFDLSLSYLNRACAYAGPESMETAECYNDMGYVYVEQGQFDKATQYLSQSLDLRKKLVSGNHPKIAVALNSMASCLAAQGKTNEALEYHHKSLAVRQAAFGDNSIEVALSYYNIGVTLVGKKEYEKSIDYIKRALSIVKLLKQGEKERQLLCNIYDGLATAYSEKADHEETLAPPQVLEYHKKALELRLQLYGENNIETAVSYHNMGTTIVGKLSLQVLANDTVTNVDMSEGVNALSYLMKSWNIKKNYLDENHSHIQETKAIIQLLGKIYCILGFHNMEKDKFADMIQQHMYGLEILNLTDSKEEYPFMETVSSALGQMLQVMEQYEKSVVYLDYALKLAKTLHDEQEISSLKETIEKTYLLWLKAEPDNKQAKERYDKFKTGQ